MSNLKIKLIKSPHGRIPKHRGTLRGLGLRKIGQEIILPNRPEVQGMVRAIDYLLAVEEVS